MVLCTLQSKMIELSLLSAAEVDWLNDYHEQVWQKVMHIVEALYVVTVCFLCPLDFAVLGLINESSFSGWQQNQRDRGSKVNQPTLKLICFLSVLLQVSALLDGSPRQWLWENTRPLVKQ